MDGEGHCWRGFSGFCIGLLTGIGEGIERQYRISKDQVCFRQWSDAEIARASSPEQAAMRRDNEAKALTFPCSPHELLAFVLDENMVGGRHFHVPEAFRKAVLLDAPPTEEPQQDWRDDASDTNGLVAWQAAALEAQRIEHAQRQVDPGGEHEDAGGEAKNYEQGLADLFDPVKKEQLEAMFPAGGKWERYAEHAKRTGLISARVERGKFNPFLAARWWIDSQGPAGWDWEKCLRKLAKNLPARSRDSKHLLTGDFD